MNAGVSALRLRVLDTGADGFDAELERLIAFEAAQDPAIDATVAEIIADVRIRGDAALVLYTLRFDRFDVREAALLEIGAETMRSAFAELPAPDRNALRAAAARIRTFHERQKSAGFSFRETDGTDDSREVRA